MIKSVRNLLSTYPNVVKWREAHSAMRLCWELALLRSVQGRGHLKYDENHVSAWVELVFLLKGQEARKFSNERVEMSPRASKNHSFKTGFQQG